MGQCAAAEVRIEQNACRKVKNTRHVTKKLAYSLFVKSPCVTCTRRYGGRSVRTANGRTENLGLLASSICSGTNGSTKRMRIPTSRSKLPYELSPPLITVVTLCALIPWTPYPSTHTQFAARCEFSSGQGFSRKGVCSRSKMRLRFKGASGRAHSMWDLL
jgi:hypothetical protein